MNNRSPPQANQSNERGKSCNPVVELICHPASVTDRLLEMEQAEWNSVIVILLGDRSAHSARQRSIITILGCTRSSREEVQGITFTSRPLDN